MKATACAVLAMVGLSFAVPAAAQNIPAKPLVVDDPAYTKPQQLVDIGGGRRLNLYCRGEGSPTVVFDSGLGDSTVAWALVQPTIARKTRTCSYDRAGLGFSDAAKRPNDAKNDAEDLHALLHAAHIAPPYILVGHSAAGLAVRVYADRYRDEVVGMVIVDGTHEDQSKREDAIGPFKKEQWEATLKDTSCLDAAKNGAIAQSSPVYKKCVADEATEPRYSQAIKDAVLKYAATLKWQSASASEKKSVFDASADETRTTRKDFGDMPIIVLTHAPHPWPKDWTQALQDRHTLVWEDMHNDLAAMSTHGVNEIVPHAGHYIQYDRPEIVIDAIDQVLSIANNQASQSAVASSK
ncbi:alpha/beta hydrolase [Dyella sp.]|uniref:alpha/beta hydrolase n=1 Tax=Dyella sp. TaxID=1869338 RepID=UPI002B47C815|nr:alpha/beta hydrolase [Dyella sp.]HKT29361.1 alpha/beta hydrolase [Dyella sp.]